MDNGDPRFPYPRFLRVPFIFVPHGAPPPLEWMAEHPGWVKFPATFVPRAPQPAPEQSPELRAEPMAAPEPVPSEASARHLPRDQRRVVPPPLFEGDPRLTRPRPEWLRKVVPPPQPMLPPPPDTRPDWLRRIVPPPEPRSAPVRPPDFRAADALHEPQRKGMDLAMRLSMPEGRSVVIHEALGSLGGQPKRSGMAVLAAWAEANGIGAKLSDAGTATVAAARAASPTSPQPASPRISDTEAAARFKAAAWAAHDSALSPEEYATREYRLKVSDAARRAADVIIADRSAPSIQLAAALPPEELNNDEMLEGGGPQTTLGSVGGGEVEIDEATKPTLTGQRFDKLGTVVHPPSLKVTGFVKHGINNAINRGVSPSEILSTINNPSIVLQQSGGKFLYLSNQAGVVVSATGKVITTYPSSKFSPKILSILKSVSN